MAGLYQVMNKDERLQAQGQAFGDFFKGLQGRLRKRRVFAALDEAADRLEAMRLQRSDGEALAGVAAGYCAALEVVEFFRRKGVAITGPAERRQFEEVFGKYVAEAFLKARKAPASADPPLLAFAVTRDELEGLVKSAMQAGAAVDPAADGPLAGDRSIGEAVDYLAELFASYESAIPETNEDGTVPARIQDRGIAKAAFAGLRAEDLKRQFEGTTDDLEDATRAALISRLTERYAGQEQEIARILLSDGGDPLAAAMTTRLMPLREVSTGLSGLEARLSKLNGRYFETGPAEWFLFKEVVATPSALIIRGDLLGYRVSASEVKEEARLQPARYREEITVRLREGVRWAETNARRASSLTSIRRVLRRTESAEPLPALAGPSALGEAPFDRCDPRTLWIVELLQRELSTAPFRVDDYVSVGFEREPVVKGSGSEAPSPKRKPRVTAVSLKGELLISHPEVCSLILDGRRLVRIDLAVEAEQAFMKVRLAWANDHISVLSSSSDDGLTRHHEALVRQVRLAAPRVLTKQYLELPMQRVVANAKLTEGDDLDGVIGEGAGESA